MDRFVNNVNQNADLLDELGETVEGGGDFKMTFSVLSIETKTIKSDCSCEIDIDLDMFEAPYGGLWVNIFMSSTKELGSFTKDDSKLSLIDYSIA